MTLGTPADGTLADAESAFYQVAVAANQTLDIDLTSEQSAALNELYVGFGTMPTRGQYDYRFSSIPTISGHGKASYRASYCVILCP